MRTDRPVRRRRFSPGGVIGALLLLGIWATAAAVVNREVLVPGPLRVLQEAAAIVAQPASARIILGSLLRWGAAFLLAGTLGSISGVLAFRYAWFADGIRPLIISVRAIPVIAIILIALVWLPLQYVGVLVGLLVAYPLIHQGVYDGLRAVPREFIALGRVFRVSRLRAALQIYLPGSLPVILSTVISAVGMSWKAVIAAEVLSQPAFGIGTALQTAKLYIQTPRVFAWTLIAVLLAAAADGLLLLIDTRLRNRQSGSPGAPGAQPAVAPPDASPHAPGTASAAQTAARPGAPPPVAAPPPTAPPLTHTVTPSVTPTAVQLHELDFAYSPSSPVFGNLQLEIPAGEITVIFGPSGCGKTTLLQLIAGMLQPTAGRIERSDSQNPRTSFVFQEPRLLPWASVRGNLELSCSHLPRGERRERCRELRQQVRVPQERAFPHELSGGMQQRINLARGFLHPAGLICLDEPFANQDRRTRDGLLRLAQDLHTRYHTTMLWVTHDPHEAAAVADRIVLLHGSFHGELPAGVHELIDLRSATAREREQTLQRLSDC